MNKNDVLRTQPGIKRYFNVQRNCFACIGINITSLERTIINKWQFWLLTLTMAAGLIPIFTYVVLNIQDLDGATDALSPFWQIVIAIFKIFYIKFSSRKIVMVTRKVWLWNLEVKGLEQDIVAAENHKDIIFCTCYHAAVTTTGIMALLSPLLTAGYYAWHGENFWNYLEAPLKGSYINDKTVFGYTIIYILNIITIFVLINASVATDSLYSWFMCNIVAHFRILKYRLHQAGKQNDGQRRKKAIFDCIAYHCRILELTNDFNNAFRFIVFIKFTISCTEICCLVFQLSRGGEMFDMVYYCLFFISVSLQLTLYCYGGQRIQDESSEIANEIYQSFRWEILTVSEKKMLIFAIRRSQKCCSVSGMFFTADLSLLLWVYRTAASFITLLWTLEDDNEMQ